jgi:hypothetical protein
MMTTLLVPLLTLGATLGPGEKDPRVPIAQSIGRHRAPDRFERWAMKRPYTWETAPEPDPHSSPTR